MSESRTLHRLVNLVQKLLVNNLKAIGVSYNLKTLIISIVLTYLITSMHHAYGAWLYDTPWRNHIVSQGGVWLLVCFIFLFVYIKWNQKWSYWIFFILSFFFFFGTLGLYEGLYNHVLKNILYYGEFPESWLNHLYPIPKYEMPNDFLFEMTGILTFVTGTFYGYVTIQYLRFIVLKRLKNRNKFHSF